MVAFGVVLALGIGMLDGDGGEAILGLVLMILGGGGAVIMLVWSVVYWLFQTKLNKRPVTYVALAVLVIGIIASVLVIVFLSGAL